MKRRPRLPPLPRGSRPMHDTATSKYEDGVIWVAVGPGGNCGHTYGHVHHTQLGAERCRRAHPGIYNETRRAG